MKIRIALLAVAIVCGVQFRWTDTSALPPSADDMAFENALAELLLPNLLPEREAELRARVEAYNARRFREDTLIWMP